MSILIPLASIDPNPWQPRTRFNDDALIELATDIERNGLLQPSLGRLVEPDGAGSWKLHGEARTGLAVNAAFVERLLASGARVQLAAGERRFRAYKILQAKGAESGAYVADLFARPAGFDALPLQLAPFDDVRMATLAWSENESRQDTTPVERARFLHRLTQPVEAGGFGWTQQRAADEVGMDRASVTNLVGLLRLPDVVLGALDAGEISQRQARAMVPMWTLDERQQEAFARTSKETYSSASPKKRDELLSRAKGGASAEEIRRNVKWFTETVNTEADRMERDAARKAEIAAQRAGAKSGADTRLVLADMKHSEYTETADDGSYMAVPGCSPECVCRALAVNRHGAEVSVCTDPARRKGLREAAEKAAKKLVREAGRKKLAAAVAAIEKGKAAAESVALEYFCRQALKSVGASSVTAAVKALGLGERYTIDKSFSKAVAGYDEKPRRAALAPLAAADVVALAIRATIEDEIAHTVEYSRKLPLENHYLRLIPALLAKPKASTPLAPDVSADTPAPAREEGDWERATRLDLQEGVDPAVNLADVEARFQEARAHYRALRELDAPEEFASARARLADLGRALALSRAAMPPATDEPHNVPGPNAEPDEMPEVSADTSAETETPADASGRWIAFTGRAIIVGIGTGDVEARADARRWAADSDTSWENVETVPADADLVARVWLEGGEVEWHLGTDGIAHLGTVLARPATSAETEDAGRTLYESGPDDDITKHPVTTSAEAPALTPEQRIEALHAGDVDVLRDMSDATLKLASERGFMEDWPAAICEAIRTEEARRAAEFDAPVAEAGPVEGEHVASTRRALADGCAPALLLARLDGRQQRVRRELDALPEHGFDAAVVELAEELDDIADALVMLDPRHVGDGSTAAAEIAPEVAGADA